MEGSAKKRLRGRIDDLGLRESPVRAKPMSTVVCAPADAFRDEAVASELDAVDARIFLGRQPIFDRRREVVAYELLYRTGGPMNAASFADGAAATQTVLCNALTEFGLDRIADGRDVLVNFPPSILNSGLPEALPADRVIVEVLEDVEPSPAMVENFRRLRAAGCRLALDDVVFDPRLAPLLELVDLIKVDLRETPEADWAGHVGQMRQLAPKATLLAEKVETADELDRCVGMGFDLFQGYFFCRPQVIEGRSLSSDRSRTLQVLAQLQNDELPLSDAASLIAGDPTLSLKLLRYINSAAVGLTRNVDSIKRAAALVGRDKLRVWATLIGLSGLSTKPRELMVTANIRARMCELIGESCYNDRSGAFFTVGLFSLLDAFTDTRLDDLLQRLPLSAELMAGLLNNDGRLGETLAAVRAWESGLQPDDQFDAELMQRSYVDAIDWTNTTLSGLAV